MSMDLYWVLGSCLLALPLSVLAIGGWRIHHPSQPKQRPEPKPDDWGRHPDDLLWEAEATSLVHGALANIREAANKWSQSIAGLLGVFGIAAFLKGPDQLDDVPGSAAYVVGAVLLAAVISAGIATYLAALSAQGTPKFVVQMDGWTLKEWQRLTIRKSVRLFAWSRLLAIVAALLLIAGAVIGSLARLEARDDPHELRAIIIRDDGSVSCGQLQGSEPELELDGESLRSAVEIVLIDECP